MTSPSRLFESITHLSGILRDLEDMGIHVEIGDDFAKYRAYRAQHPDRGPIYPMFDVASSYIDFTNGFWICGFDPDGKLMHTQAVRNLDSNRRGKFYCEALVRLVDRIIVDDDLELLARLPRIKLE